MILYISLRWYAEIYLSDGRYTTDQLNKVFRGFFWRNALTGRYDQGFLTRFKSDQVKLKSILKEARQKKMQHWPSFCNKGLDESFGEQHAALNRDRIVQLLKEGEIRGALRQAFSLFLYSKARIDWVEGSPLNRFSDEKGRLVQLHHIFPQQWCKDNKGGQPVLKDNDAILDCFANLVPLTAKSNLDWRSKSPSTAIAEFDLDFASDQRFSTALVDSEAFEFLKSDDPEGFWNRRATQMAEELYQLQFVS